MFKRIVILLAVLLCAALSVGCEQAAGGAVTNGPTQTARSMRVSSFYVVQSSEGQQANEHEVTSLEGYVDVADQRAQFTFSKQGRSFQQVIVGDDLYSNDGGGWVRVGGGGRSILASFAIVNLSAQQAQAHEIGGSSDLGSKTLDGVTCRGYGERQGSGDSSIYTTYWLAADNIPRRIVVDTHSGKQSSRRQLDISRLNQPINITVPRQLATTLACKEVAGQM